MECAGPTSEGLRTAHFSLLLQRNDWHATFITSSHFVELHGINAKLAAIGVTVTDDLVQIVIKAILDSYDHFMQHYTTGDMEISLRNNSLENCKQPLDPKSTKCKEQARVIITEQQIIGYKCA
uniref:Uncharacterized protein n=1 Tax=Physcomitrium patens TaxID=3218 RepID=A0A7I4A5B6_PHYPA